MTTRPANLDRVDALMVLARDHDDWTCEVDRSTLAAFCTALAHTGRELQVDTTHGPTRWTLETVDGKLTARPAHVSDWPFWVAEVRVGRQPTTLRFFAADEVAARAYFDRMAQDAEWRSTPVLVSLTEVVGRERPGLIFVSPPCRGMRFAPLSSETLRDLMAYPPPDEIASVFIDGDGS